MDISLFLQKNTPKQLAATIYNLPRLGTTTGVPGTELFGEEWANQLVSQCLLPHDVSLALQAPLRQPLSASIGRRTSVIPGARSQRSLQHYTQFFNCSLHAGAGVLSPIAKVLLAKQVMYSEFLCVVAMATMRWYGLHR
jgi:hypothetical protein